MNENGGKSSTILLTVIGIATLLVVVVGATFAYFAAQITGDESTSVTITAAENGSKTESFTGSDTVIEENMYPRAAHWAKQAVTLSIANANANAEGSTEYTFTINGTNEFPVEVEIEKVKRNLFNDIQVAVKNVSVVNNTNPGTTLSLNLDANYASEKNRTLQNGSEIIGTIVIPNNTRATVSFDVYLYFVEQEYNQNDNANPNHKASFSVSYTSRDYKKQS